MKTAAGFGSAAGLRSIETIWKGAAVEGSSAEQQARQVLMVLDRVQRVFGGERSAEAPPEFRPPRDLMNNLGLGRV